MNQSRVLQKLRSGKAALMTSNSAYPWPGIVELIGLLDFDAVWLDMEHQNYHYGQVFDMALACRATGMDAMIRIRKGAYWSYSRAFETGANGIMVPHCRSGEEAREIVRFSRFAPEGMRGMDGVEPAAAYGLAPMADYMAHANRETFIAVQIEDADAVDNVDDIAAVEGIDILFVGPADLSQSLAVPLQFDHRRMREAIERVAAAAARYGKWWGIPVGSPEQAEIYYEMGARFLAAGSAINILREGFQQLRADYDVILKR